MKNKLSIFLFGFIVQISGCIFGTGYDTYVDKNIKPLKIHAIVVGKFDEEMGCFGAIVIKSIDKIDTIKNIFICTMDDQKIWSYVLKNDSIYKEKGTLDVMVVRNGNIKRFTFPTRD